MKAFTVKLYTSEYEGYLHDMVNIAGIIYNTALTILQDFYRESGTQMKKNDLQKILKDIRNDDEHRHWKMVGSQVVQEISDRIYRSYDQFFEKRKKGLKASPPKRKKVRKYKSMTYKQAGYKFLPGGKVRIGGHVFRYWDSYDGFLDTAKIHTVTVKRNTLGEFFLHVVADCPVTMRETRDGRGSIGMDFGLKNFLTLSDGTVIESPRFYQEGIKGIRKANRALSRKKEGSNGYRKAKETLYRRHEKIADCRKDWFWKTAHMLCSRYSIICIEDLDMRGMAKLWGRKVHDYGYSEFVKILEWVARQYGTIVQKVDRFFPSSQTCSVCGYVNKDVKNLRVREWDCPVCHSHHRRDENAARSILKEGLRILGIEQAETA